MTIAGRDAWIKPSSKTERTHDKPVYEKAVQEKPSVDRSKKREVKAEEKKKESNNDFKKLLGF